MVVCLLLMALFAYVQVAHFHANQREADHCTLCIAMHSAAPVAAQVPVVVLVPVGIPAPTYKARSIVRYWHPKLFTRPPPSDL